MTPKTESRARLLEIMRRMDCQDLFDDAFNALCNYEAALRQEAASKAVAQVLDRLERRVTKLTEGYVSQDRQMGYDVALALIRQERPATPVDPQDDEPDALIASERGT